MARERMRSAAMDYLMNNKDKQIITIAKDMCLAFLRRSLTRIWMRESGYVPGIHEQVL